MNDQCQTIFVVEDNADDLALMKRAIRKAGLRVEIEYAHDGHTAISDLTSRMPADLPALVLLDLQLPRLSGVQTLEQLRASERTRLLPIIILTTSREQRDRLVCYRAGCNSFVRKPVDYEQFVRVVKQLCAYWLNLNEPPPS